MYFKKLKSFLAIFIVATFIMPQSIYAYSDYIIAGGENIGLQINNNGIIVAGFYKVDNEFIGKNANLNKGDVIKSVDNNKVSNIEEFVNAIKNSNGQYINLTYMRNNKENNTTLYLKSEDGVFKTGLYVKDMITGIGTLTYIDPKTKIYGALGHEVIEASSGVMLDVKDGKIYNSTVTGIDKSMRGDPGYKNALADSNDVFGAIKENTISGIFGNYTKKINDNKLYKVAEYKDIKLGEAKIITVINGYEKQEYEIEILKVNNDEADNKNILFEIKNEELISKTGGIVQGMSGSPIIQGENIIGAVTNVVVNNPKKGYGILITTMLKEGEN